MAYAEKRGGSWRARWRAPDGTVPSKPGFRTRKAAEDYGRDQEAAIRAGTYVDPQAGRITLTEWVNRWFPALDLEPATLAYYRNMIEVHILPAFGDRSLASLATEDITSWEMRIAGNGYSPRTAQAARSTLVTILEDAVPRYIQVNPAHRKRRRGRKGQRRIEQHEKAGKAWATPLQALLAAERCAALSGSDTDSVLILTLAYTGMRWSEAVGLRTGFVRSDRIGIEWKLYELKSRFYLGRPKAGSIRDADLPPFLAELLARHLDASPRRRCRCRNPKPPWCQGDEYVFLGPGGGHFRRSNYSRRFLRPAADGWYPADKEHEAAPMLADAAGPFPGEPLPPWPAAQPDQAFTPPAGRGVKRLASDATTGRCPKCGRAVRRRLDGCLITHGDPGDRCEGSGQPPAEDVTLVSWLPILTGLTPHGLRHGHQTWLEEAGIPYLLVSERMGHEVPGMRGVYGHVSPAMREKLKAVLQECWEDSLRQRARISPRSRVRLLDALLASCRASPYQDRLPSGSQNRTPGGREPLTG